jgi:hypothetical protein
MERRITNHIRSNIVGYIALFLFAMGGTAYALDGPLPGQNQVGSEDIINGEVKTLDIGTGEVKNGDIGPFEIKANNIAPDSLGGAKIADRSVKNADLGLGASSSNTIADGGIQGIDVKNNTLTGTQIDELALDLSLLQRRIADSCAPGQAIRAVAQNGTVTCESTGGGGGASWLLAGNSGTTGADFLGTTDNNPLNLRVNNARGLRLEPASDGTNQSPNVIGGIADNSVAAGAYGATIAGGGRRIPSDSTTANRVTDSVGTVGGGGNNQAGDGAGTVDDKPFAVVGGGSSNTASGSWATVSGGNTNTAGDLATVAGGDHNEATGQDAGVGGGLINHATGFAATIPGGGFNTAQGDFSLAGGSGAKANDDGAFVWADSNPFDFASTAQDQFNVRSTGGARLVSGIDGTGNPTSGLELPAGGSGWSTLVNGQPFDVKVNGARGLRIDPASDGTNQSPNVIGGIADNQVTPGVHSAVIGGGGRGTPSDPTTANRVTDHQGTVGGGANNQAGDDAGTVGDATLATVGGGGNNNATGEAATVGGGFLNHATASRATVAGGDNNTASGLASSVVGGLQNTAQGDFSLAAGRNATAGHDGSFVWADSHFWGFNSTAADQFAVRAMGGVRLVSGDSFGTPTSGLELPAGESGWSTVAPGQPFDIKVNNSRGLRIEPASDGTNESPNVIGGIADNSITSGAFAATIAGGGRGVPADPATANRVTDTQGTVGGGVGNTAGDGAGTTSDQGAATVGGGFVNTASGQASTVGGGENNTASGSRATVPGGRSNVAQGDFSLAAGHDAQAIHQGAFVWADSSFSDFASTAANQFSVRSTGGARFVSAIDVSGNPTAGVQLAPGGGSWSSLSDRAAKRAIEPASGRRVLRKLSSVPVSTWSYRAQDRSIRHIGPMAQDFYRAFGVGEDNKHIASVDADGVSLAATKGLASIVDRQRARIHHQAEQNRSQDRKIAKLERALRRFSSRR